MLAQQREHYAANRATIRERERQRIAADPEPNRARVRAWRAANPERKRATDVAYQKANAERLSAQGRAWRQRNAARKSEIDRTWRAANQDKVRVYQWRYSEQKRGQFVEHVDRMAVFARDDGLCQICGQSVDVTDFHLDHVVPVSKGGEHSYANLQLAHPACNRRKGARLAA